MATDNMLAVGGASHGNLFLLIFGLGLSIPFVVFTSNLLSMLMDKYPLDHSYRRCNSGKGRRGNDTNRPFCCDYAEPRQDVTRYREIIFAIGVIVAGKAIDKMENCKGREEGACA